MFNLFLLLVMGFDWLMTKMAPVFTMLDHAVDWLVAALHLV